MHQVIHLQVDAFKIALYTSSADLSIPLQLLTAEQLAEVASGGGYTTGWRSFNKYWSSYDKHVTSFTDFSDVSWTSASFTARGCLIYNSSDVVSGLTNNRAAVCGITFGGDKTVSSGTFTIQFPANDSSDAIIRITS